MAFSIRTQTVVTPRPTQTLGGRPSITAATNSVGQVATVASGLWTGPRNTYAYAWWRGTTSVGSAASYSFQSAGTHSCVVTVTNPYGSRVVGSLPITVL